MALKQSYGVRTPMLANSLDSEITLQKDGVGLRPLPVKFVLITIGSFCLMLKLITSDTIAVGSIPQKVIFVVLWLAMTVMLFFQSKTQQLNCRMLVSLLGYLSIPGNRVLHTRKLDPDAVLNMIDITNIKRIDDNGLIHFADKQLGYMYRITGNASVLLFEQDRNSILNRTDTFYRTLEPDISMIYLTLKEPQRVYQQAAAIKRRHNALTVHDDDLTKLANNQLKMLRETVGHKFKSVHQYLILKAPNADALLSAKQALQTELNQSAMWIRKCVPLDMPEIVEQLAVAYSSPKPGDGDDMFGELK
jgi:hypothetical protein